MKKWEPALFKDYRWIIVDPESWGKLAIQGTRFSVSFILSCLAEGMRGEEIEKTYAPFPHEAIPEIMRVASEILDLRMWLLEVNMPKKIATGLAISASKRTRPNPERGASSQMATWSRRRIRRDFPAY